MGLIELVSGRHRGGPQVGDLRGRGVVGRKSLQRMGDGFLEGRRAETEEDSMRIPSTTTTKEPQHDSMTLHFTTCTEWWCLGLVTHVTSRTPTSSGLH